MKILFILFTIVGLNITDGLTSFDKQEFYTAISTEDKDKVEKQLDVLKTSVIPEKNAYEGVLLMRKAGLVSKPFQKLNLFKEGGKKLESAISANPKNYEFRFLRLMIQENAPKFMGYHNEIDEDKNLIIKHFKDLDKIVQQSILGYCKKSKVLHNEDF